MWTTFRRLFTWYVEWLDRDLYFLDFHQERAFYLARTYHQLELSSWQGYRKSTPALGCVVVRPLVYGDINTCKVRRLSVVDVGCDFGVGTALFVRTIDEAREMGCRTTKPDTLPDRMEGAIRLCNSIGFV